MALYSELLKEFKNADVPLSTKLLAAKTLFCRPEFCYVDKKEELVLEWLLEMLDHETPEGVWLTIKDCLLSDSMKNVQFFCINPTTLVNILIQSLEKYLQMNEGLKAAEYCIIIECSILILETPFFFYYFRSRSKEYISLCNVVLKSCSKNNNENVFIQFVQTLPRFFDPIRQEKLINIFYKKIFLTIIQTYCYLKKTGNSLNGDNPREEVMNENNISDVLKKQNCRDELINLISCIVFPSSLKTNFFKELHQLEEHQFDNARILQSLCRILLKAYSDDSEVVVNTHVLLFEAFICNFGKNSSEVFNFFVFICALLGFEPNIKNGDKNVCLLSKKSMCESFNLNIYPTKDVSLEILKELLGILKKVDLEFDVTLHGISFVKWMQALVLQVVGTSQSTYLIFNIVSAIMELIPSFVEPIARNILAHVVLLPKVSHTDNLAYTALFHAMFNVFIKMHRVQIFVVSILLPTLKQLIGNHESDDHWKNISDVVPETIYLEWTNVLTGFPGIKCVKLLGALTKVLKEIVEPMQETPVRWGRLCYLKVVEQFLVCFLRGVRMADQSVPQTICDSFKENLVELQRCLDLFAEGLLQLEHSAECLTSFLRICLAVGEVQILLLHYSPWSRQNFQQLQLAASVESNVIAPQCLHYYLSLQQWTELGGKAVNNGDECKEAWVDLLLQELRTLVLFQGSIENGIEFQTTLCDSLTNFLKGIQFLNKSVDAAFVLPLLPQEKLIAKADEIVNVFVNSGLNDEVIKILSNPLFQENKCFVAAILWTCVQKIGNILTKRKRNHHEHLDLNHIQLMKGVLSSINVLHLIRHDKKKKITQYFLEISHNINQACINLLDDKIELSLSKCLDLNSLSRYLLVLHNLPVTFLNWKLRTFLVLSTLSVVVVLSEQKKATMKISTRTDEERCSTEKQLFALINICKEIIQGLLDSPEHFSLSNLVDIGLVLRLLLWSGHCPRLLLEKLIESCKEKPERLQEWAESIYVADEYFQQNIEADSPPVLPLLLKVLIKVNLKHLSKDNRDLFKKSMKAVQYFIIQTIKNRMKAETISEKTIYSLLEAYSCVLPFRCSTTLVPYAEQFFSAAFSDRKNFLNSEVFDIQNIQAVILDNLNRVNASVNPETAWCMCKSSNKPDVAANFLKDARDDIFSLALEELAKPLKKEEESSELLEFKLLTSLVRISPQLSDSKAREVEFLIMLVSRTAFQKIMAENCQEVVPEFLHFLLAVAQRKDVPLPHAILDIFFATAAHALMSKKFLLEAVLEIVHSITKMLFVLLKDYYSLILRRIPIFMEIYHMLMRTIMEKSALTTNQSVEQIESLAKCALRLAQLSKCLVSHTKDFRLVSQYMVADILQDMQKFEIKEHIKGHIMNSLYSALSLCDDSAVKHLSFALPSSSLELFKTAMADYKKFHMYTGKV